MVRLLKLIQTALLVHPEDVFTSLALFFGFNAETASGNGVEVLFFLMTFLTATGAFFTFGFEIVFAALFFMDLGSMLTGSGLTSVS